MHPNIKKEQFSLSFVRAIAAVSGYVVSIPEVDDDSIDLTLAGRGPLATSRRPRLDIQLKSRAAPEVIKGHVVLRVSRKNYDDLRAKDLIVPRVIVLVALPEDGKPWTEQSDDELKLRKSAYWLSLRGRKKRNCKTISIHIPLKHLLTPIALEAIMSRVQNRVDL